ncbi:MAG: PHP domain-containing protein [Clostridiales bacterium]|jgi:predicted metal-dependent phosphoesterase TrpH|nr:PHP domain-containing protein [Clostridiales bacterium]
MKKLLLVLFLAVFIVFPACAQSGGIPNLKGYVTLKCDFHIHTVFSDGTVWPTVRIDEAYREGLDAIAITDHIDYHPHNKDIVGSHNRSYEIAEPTAKSRGIILVKGCEITRKMPPGHFNAIFLTDVDKLDKPEYMDIFRAAQAQNAFIFWNHPQWEPQQPDVTLWWPEHTRLLEQGIMQGIEVVNSVCGYSPEAHQWCLEKKLTMLGGTDIHAPMQVFTSGRHRIMTLVFARSKTPEAIHEALKERRTAVYYNEYVIGEEMYLKELFESAVEINVTKTGNTARITFKNKSDLVFNLRETNHDERLTYFRNYNLYPYIIKPQSTQSITVRLNEGIKGGDVNFIVENFLVEPSTGMKYTLKI